jgi:signal transduction histidine kinase
VDAPPASAGPAVRGHARGLSALALGLILLSLAASLLVPVLLQRRIDGIRAQVDEGADPARTAVTALQFALAREMSALRGFLITGDSAFIATYRQAWRQELDAQRRLEPLARGLGDEVLERFVVLRTLSRRWHEEAPAEEVARGRATLPRPLEISVEQELYEDALVAARDLDDAIVRAARLRAGEIRAIERVRLAVTAVLLLLAFAAAVVVAWLGRQVGRLAREAEAQRATAVRALEETRSTLASRQRLVRGVTHDIKNPLGAADGYGELLQMGLHGELGPEQAHAVTRIRGCIADALSIISDLLELSAAENGSLPVSRRDADLSVVVVETADEYAASARAAGRPLRVEAAHPVHAVTDPARVRQVLGNLVSNAVKYARGSDRIVLSAGYEDAGPRPGRWAVVRVEDFGPGIAPADRERLFEEFYRVDADTGVEGHGLGLSVSRRIARLLGGELTVESEVGRGSVFTLWLPL